MRCGVVVLVGLLVLMVAYMLLYMATAPQM